MSSAEKQMALQRKQIALNNNNQDQINDNIHVRLENLQDQDIPENNNTETEISQLLDEELSEKQNVSPSKLSAMSQSLQQPKIQSKQLTSQNGLLKLNTVGYNQMKSSYGLSSTKIADSQTKNQNFFRYPEEIRQKQNSITLSQSNKNNNNNQKPLQFDKNQKQKNSNSKKSQSIQQFPSLVA
ncbi:hypothetical protein PPERSA_10654 [Pseudocohnilembus persalinus]|uniref:Uncharacterized protein n=1 Tax=Pseudocohnilembus persalinus TaxID=266149 RepID=A0A0V0QD75_PSEPJ|nr:hypothetical protein PPERSA_10654 [Pseudocohnilembus persalinus]|eukprot:KRX00155.1 hypothetical protein PPERSA_10654 [Pseudocohnilembus persalinus]